MFPAGGQAAAPSGVSSSGQGEGGGAGGGFEGGGGGQEGGRRGPVGTPDGKTLDFQSAFLKQKKDLDGTRSSLDRVAREFAQHKEKVSPDLELLGRMKEVFNPKEAQAPNPVQEWEDQLDYYIAQGLEAERRGQAIPLTVNLAVTHFKSLIENHEREQRTQAEMARMRAELDQVRNPEHVVNMSAYQNIDAQVIRGIEQLYGNDPATQSTRVAMFEAAASWMKPQIQQLQRENPQAWDQLRRNPQKLAELANHAIRQIIPPKVQQHLAQEQLQNYDMPMSELYQAMSEAKSIQDPEKRQEVTAQIRREILEKMYRSGKLGKLDR